MRYLLFVLLATYSLAFSASENLDELSMRRARHGASTWDNTTFESSSDFVWRGEGLAYKDIDTGHDVRRIAGGRHTKNLLPDLNHSGWSADGKRFVFGSQRDTKAFASTYEDEYEGVVMIMNADGSRVRPLNGGPFKVFVHSRYFNWSPVDPDIYYGFGRNYAKEGFAPDDLYKVVVSDTGVTQTKIYDFNLAGEFSVTKSFSPDGTTLRATGNSRYYFFDRTLEGVTAVNPAGWVIGRQLDNYWGGSHTPADTNYTMHYSGVVGVGANKKLYTMAEGYTSVWSWELTGGTAADGGPEHIVDHEPPYDWGGIRPVISGDTNGGVCALVNKTPWCCDGDAGTDCDRYMSHNTYDRWGKYMIGANAQVGDYWAIWNLLDHKYKDALISTGSTCGWHTDWNAWSDYFATSSYTIPTAGLGGLYIVNHQNSQKTRIASVHVREAGSVSYDSLPRVTQSPDGTKLIFHSDFLRQPYTVKAKGYVDGGNVLHVESITTGGVLNIGDYVMDTYNTIAKDQKIVAFGTGMGGVGTYLLSASQSNAGSATSQITIFNRADGWDMFSATAYNPHPPEITSVTSIGGSYVIRFDWRLATTPRGYTTRGWPNEATDNPPPPRETKLFRLWKSPTGTGNWTPAGTVLANIFDRYDFATGQWKGNNYWEIKNEIEPGTWYYAVTAHEWSGLESRTLSNVFSSAGVQTAAYPADPKADTNFVTAYNADITAAYNIYAHDGSAPAVSQSNRIATIPASDGQLSAVDWTGNPDGSTHYVVTAVDFQGNESGPLETTFAPRTTPGQYDVSWTSTAAPPPVCDGDHLNLCDSGNCSAAGGYYYDGFCNATPQIVCSPTARDKCTVDDCETTGEGYWCSGSCQPSPCTLPGAVSRYRFGSGPEKVINNE